MNLHPKYIFIFFSLIFNLISHSQDIHWSQFNDNQIFQNPGNSGNFKGDYRFITNRRNQWKSVTEPFTTTNISVDKKLKRNAGIGVLFFDDVAGDGKFRTNEFQLNIGYPFKIFKDTNATFKAGLNVGVNHRQVNMDLFTFNNQYNGMYYDEALPSNENFTNQKNTSFTIGIGSTFNYSFSKLELEFGTSIFNLNRPNQSFYNNEIKRDARLSTFIKTNYPINNLLSVQPSCNIQIQGVYRSLIIGSNIKYNLSKTHSNYLAVFLGAWLRNKDAAIFNLGVDYQNWFVGLSYDVNLSNLSIASNYRGGSEIAIRYIIQQYKPKKITHRICPDYL